MTDQLPLFDDPDTKAPEGNSGITPGGNKRYRWQYKFWLDAHNPADYAVAEAIAALKAQRAFTQAIRDGLRLVADLRARKTDVLLELFPWVKEALAQPAASDLFNELLKMRGDLAELKAQRESAAQSVRPLDGVVKSERRTAAPDQRAELLVISTAPAGKANAAATAANFLASAGSFFD